MRYDADKESFFEIVKESLLFLGVFGTACVCFRFIYEYLVSLGVVNLDMYNIKVRGGAEVLRIIPEELFNSFIQLFKRRSFLGGAYCLLCGGAVIVAAGELLFFSKKKLICAGLIAAVFISSRFAFLVSAASSIGAFRMEYWARAGLLVFGLAVFFRKKSMVYKNLVLFWCVMTLCLFVKTDFFIQKIQYLGFYSGRLFQARLWEKVVTHPEFVNEPRYIALNFGQPNFRRHFFDDSYLTEELLGYGLFFDFDVENELFWDEKVSPVIIGAKIDNNGREILRVDRGGKEKWENLEYWSNNPENMKNIRWWLYMEAKQGDVYIDDKYMIMVFDKLVFYKNRELVAEKLDDGK